MEGDSQPVVPLDPAAMEGCRRTEIWTSSDTSDLTGEDSRDSVEYEDIEGSVLPMAETMSTEWTDEKHSLYLNSMEASFVKQLYHSMDLLGWRSQEIQSEPNSSGQLHGNTRTSSGQFKVLREGCWQKINYERAKPQSGIVDEPRVLLANPWVRHFRSSGNCQNQTSPDVQEKDIYLKGKEIPSRGSATSSKQLPPCYSPLCRQDSIGSNAEVSDQNFVDEDYKGEKFSSSCWGKRMKTVEAEFSGKDQVVPSMKFQKTSDPSENFASSEVAEQANGDWQSEKIESFVCAETGSRFCLNQEVKDGDCDASS